MKRCINLRAVRVQKNIEEVVQKIMNQCQKLMRNQTVRVLFMD